MIRIWLVALLAALAAALPLPWASVHAQELLLNRSFEAPVTPANGNNFYATIANWTVINVTPAQAQPFNVIRPWSGYAGNPTATPAGGGTQYLDINAASGDLRQTVVIPSDGMIDFGGWFSVRDNQQALSGLVINVRTAGGTVVASVSTSFLASDPIGLWKQASAANVPISAGTYVFEAQIPNPANFDLATLVFKPAMTVDKTGVAFSDPVNGMVNPKLIPGGVAQYSITASAPAAYSVTSNSIALVDATPAGTALVVTDIGSAGSGPAGFAAGSSGLTYSFVSLSNAADDIEFSNNGGTSYAYTPVANANGTDPAVTHVRLRPKGSMAAGSSFNVAIRYRVN